MMQGMSPNERALLSALTEATLDALQFVLDSPFTPLSAKQTAAKMQQRILTAKEKLA